MAEPRVISASLAPTNVCVSDFTQGILNFLPPGSAQAWLSWDGGEGGRDGI